DRLLARDEPEAGEVVRRRFEREGIRLHTRAKALGAELSGSEKVLILEEAGRPVRVAPRPIPVPLGRKAKVGDPGTEGPGRGYGRDGGQVSDGLRTSNPRVYAAGDVCSAYKFTHAADATARVVLRNALFFGRARVSKLVIPWCTYTDPEVAHVGLTARQADER